MGRPTVRALVIAVATNLAATLATTARAEAQAPDPASAPVPFLSPALTYDGAVVTNLSGGVERRSAYIGNLNLSLTARGESIGLAGTTLYANLLTITGGSASAIVGDAQGVSNIEGPSGTQIEELWVQQNFEGNRVSALVGIYDLNSEFYRLQAASLFQNASFGIGPEFSQSGVEGPSIFPRTSVGLRVAVKPSANTVVRVAVLDGVPVVRPDGSRAAFRSGDGLLTVAEVAALSRAAPVSAAGSNHRDRIGRLSSLDPYVDKVAVGAWHYSGQFEDLSRLDAQGQPVLHQGSSGAYVIAERTLIGDSAAAARRLSGFVRAGVADERVNRFASHVSAGLVASGWVAGRTSDEVGIAVTTARNGASYREASASAGHPTDRAETTFELSYLAKVSQHLSLQPDLQYIKNPNTDPAIANAWVAQVRFEVSF